MDVTSPGYRLACLQELANGARGGHPRAVPYSKMSSKGHTKLQELLQVSLSGSAMYRKLLVTSVFAKLLKTLAKNAKNCFFHENFSEVFRKCPDASERIQTHPNSSERIRTHPNTSEQVRASPKTSKTCENNEKCAKISQRLVFIQSTPRRH